MIERSLMVVDDERFVRSAVRMLCEGDYAVTAVGSASEALSTVREEAPDVILLDLGLPDMSGIDLLARIRCLAPETAVVIMSATNQTAVIERARELGAVDYLVKPVDAEVLKQALRNAVEERSKAGSRDSSSC